MAKLEKNMFWSPLLELKRDEKHSDAFLEVEGQLIPIHSLLFKIRSSFFEAVFSRRWENSNPDSSSVHVSSGACSSKTDVLVEKDAPKIIVIKEPITSTAIELLLSYIYGGSDLLCESNIYEAWVCASYFQVEGLITLCLKYMTEVKIENCLQILRALRYPGVCSATFCEEILQQCLKFIDEHAVAIFSVKSNLNNCDIALVADIMKRDTLNIPESTLFDAILHIAKTNMNEDDVELSVDNIRTFLEQNNLLWVIRYNLLEEEKLLVDANFLSPAEIVTVRKECLGLDKQNHERKLPFNPKKRFQKLAEEEHCKRIGGVILKHPEVLVGGKISLRWSEGGERMFPGKVDHVQESGQHFVVFDDGYKKPFDLSRTSWNMTVSHSRNKFGVYTFQTSA